MSVAQNVVLSRALSAVQDRYHRALSRVLDRLGENQVEHDSAAELREAIALVDCLRRIVPTLDVNAIHKAFGAPGDFGYETPIGEALARIYRGES